jgi:hypothetical protein
MKKPFLWSTPTGRTTPPAIFMKKLGKPKRLLGSRIGRARLAQMINGPLLRRTWQHPKKSLLGSLTE